MAKGYVTYSKNNNGEVTKTTVGAKYATLEKLTELILQMTMLNIDDFEWMKEDYPEEYELLEKMLEG